MKYFLSSSITRCFPASGRSAVNYGGSKITTEQNIVDITRNYADKNFIVDGLSIVKGSSNSKINISKGSCVIHGYLFDIAAQSNVTIDSPSANKYLSFCICVKPCGDNTTSQDKLVASNDVIEENLDSDGTFYGLGTEITTNIPVDGAEASINNATVKKYYLTVAKWVNGAWQEVVDARLKYNADRLLVTLTEGNTNDATKAQSLVELLSTNYGIDDGRIG